MAPNAKSATGVAESESRVIVLPSAAGMGQPVSENSMPPAIAQGKGFAAAPRKERKYTAKDGTTRIINARPERQGLLPMGETTIWDKVRTGEFPAPIKLTERITAWRIEDVEAWMASRGLEA